MNRFVIKTLVLTLLAVAAAHLLWASEEQAFADRDIFNLILSIIENPDPIGQVQYVNLFVDPADPDAREPGQRNDGRPVFEFDRATFEPYLAWAYDVGRDHDIAFNTWDHGDWATKIEYITASPADEVDPRIFVDRYNRLYITWWEDDSRSRIMFSKHEEMSGWTLPMQIGTGRRPSVAVWEGDLVSAFERDNGSLQEIVFARTPMVGPPILQVVGFSNRTKRLDPVLHVRDGMMWIDWKQSDTTLGFSIYRDGVWSGAALKDWPDPSWYGELVARHEIELMVLNQDGSGSSGAIRQLSILRPWANWNAFGTSVSSPTSTPVKQRSRSGSSTTPE